jgi:lysophospholipase L1-like esterase
MKTIRCYGDSNTWGFVPNSINYETFYMERFPRKIRWTGIDGVHFDEQGHKIFAELIFQQIKNILI